MRTRLAWTTLALLVVVVAPVRGAHREPDARLTLWPGTPPGVSRANGPEKIVEGRPRPFYQLTDIATPELEVYLAPADRRNGTAVLVCPGGGMQRLAYEHEGLEVAEWLNSLGLTACVLKYRVPAPALTGMLDAQRAMGLIRSHAEAWGVDTRALGLIGFSAGGEIGAWLMTHSDGRGYEAVDAADQLSCRPDFSALIYPGGLLQRGGGIKDGIATNLNRGLAPVFMAHAFDDASENSLQMAVALKRARVPTEYHLFHQGAHGFGARETGLPVSEWKRRFADWLDAHGFMDSLEVRELAAKTVAALEEGRVPPPFPGALPGAYAVQRRVVRAREATDGIAGYKGAAASAAAQSALGIDGPMTGVLFRSGRLEAGDEPTPVELAPGERIAVETEIGYLMGVDFSFEVLTAAQAHDAVAAIVPVIELPRSFSPEGAAPDARNMVASNIGSARFLVGKPVQPADTDPNTWKITLHREGRLLHETTGGSAKGGQWANLQSILNNLTAQGHLIRAGDIIICGALGAVQAGEPGSYEARFGDQQTLRFTIR